MMIGQTQWVMPILRMATENKQMFKLNDPVQMNGIIGRVFAIDKLNTLHVLVRVNEYTWKVEKWYSMMCQPYMNYMWTVQSAFKTQHHTRFVKTPEFQSMKNDNYPYVLRLK